MSMLYPLKFKPIFKDKVWGGQRINTILKQEYSPLPNCGEVWVLSGVEGQQTLIANGFLEGNELNELVEIYMGELVGEKIYQKFGNEFPLLIKFIDSNDWLSVQVHPDDEMAASRHGMLGKTEMWYILHAEEGSELISGFSKSLTKAQYKAHLENKTLKSVMNFEKVKSGDVFFMPAGRIHAIGPGVLLTEIQQTSDLTYRIYDWDRIDTAGMVRELHTEAALEALDFTVRDTYRTEYTEKMNETVKMVDCPYFTTNLIHLSQSMTKDYSELDSFVVYICPEGAFKLLANDEEYAVNMGEAILLPASIDQVEIHPNEACKILEVYVAPV